MMGLDQHEHGRKLLRVEYIPRNLVHGLEICFVLYFCFFETESHVAQAGHVDGIWWWGLCRRLALGEAMRVGPEEKGKQGGTHL